MQPDILCFCHLRWNFVYQRPQHLLSRFAGCQRVFVIEDPMFGAPSAYNEIYQDQSSGVWVIIPHLPNGLQTAELVQQQKVLLEMAMTLKNIDKYMCWYYSPMALSFTSHLLPELVIYDCMDELSAFKNAPVSLDHYEKQLFGRADIVFTGGHNLYNAKKSKHRHIFPFPSSIDKEHFGMARRQRSEPADQKDIPTPRIGFYGVIDERLDIGLLDQVAKMRPEWQFILIGPIVKIDPATLPKKRNIHYLGPRSYKELPAYLSGWDIAMMPFAINESTTYISPTKTPEYLAGGKPVISTPIADVVTPYGRDGLVYIAENAREFISAGEEILNTADRETWLKKVDYFLSDISWNKTWKKMNALIEQAYELKTSDLKPQKKEVYV